MTEILGPLLNALFSEGGVLTIGWLVAGFLTWLCIRIDEKSKEKIESIQLKYDNLEKSHKEDLNTLYDKVSNLQNQRVTDAMTSKDEFVALTERVLQALSDLGAKK